MWSQLPCAKFYCVDNTNIVLRVRKNLAFQQKRQTFAGEEHYIFWYLWYAFCIIMFFFLFTECLSILSPSFFMYFPTLYSHTSEPLAVISLFRISPFRFILLPLAEEFTWSSISVHFTCMPDGTSFHSTLTVPRYLWL